MSNLSSKFDVVRGWAPSDNANTVIRETFKPDDSLDPALGEGEIVELQNDGTITRASAEDYSQAGSLSDLVQQMAERDQLWLVLSGNRENDYDGLKQTGPEKANETPAYVPWKTVCIKGTFMVETEQFVDRQYTPGDAVTVVDGKIDITNGTTNTGREHYGEVISYDSNTGVLTVCVE